MDGFYTKYPLCQDTFSVDCVLFFALSVYQLPILTTPFALSAVLKDNFIPATLKDADKFVVICSQSTILVIMSWEFLWMAVTMIVM